MTQPISIVIPVYNEEVRLRDSLEQVVAYMGRLEGRPDFEIVVSDDGSTDGSVAIAEELAADAPIRLLRAERNQGKGHAVVAGMKAAAGDPIFFFDADLSTPLEEIERFLRCLREHGADVVIGTRKHKEATIERPQPWHRVKMGLAYTRIVHWMTGTRFSDYTCGFKLFSAEARDAVFGRSRIRGWSFDAELLFLAHRLGFKVHELPVRWADEPDSRVRLGRAIFASFAELVEIRIRQLLGQYR